MNRHIIKGTGDNAELYLRYSSSTHAAGFVWVAEQRAAARWTPKPYAQLVAEQHGGHFVKLVLPAFLVPLVPHLRRLLWERAKAIELPACHWFRADFHDAGEDFCLSCAEQLVRVKHAADHDLINRLYAKCSTDEQRYKVAIDGGWDIGHDSPPYCTSCSQPLAGNLTEHGSDTEIIAMADHPPAVADALAWHHLYIATLNLEWDDPQWAVIAKIVHASNQDLSRCPAPLCAGGGNGAGG